MTLLVLERQFEQSLSRDDVIELAKSGAWCLEQYRVDWVNSLLSSDGKRMICRFESGDAESIRQALHKLETDMRVLWPGNNHQVPGRRGANVVVERSFAEPVELDELQAKEDAKQWCLDAYAVEFVSTLFSSDGKRMLCLYAAPDAESVRAAQREAEMPVDRVWSFAEISMSDLSN